MGQQIRQCVLTLQIGTMSRDMLSISVNWQNSRRRRETFVPEKAKGFKLMSFRFIFDLR